MLYPPEIGCQGRTRCSSLAHAEDVEFDGVVEKAVGRRETGPGDLVGQHPHLVGDRRSRLFRAQLWKASNELGKRAASGSLLPGLGRSFARQRDVPGTVEGEIPRQDCYAYQRRSLFGQEAQHPDLGVESPASRRAHGMHARFQHRIELASLAGNGDAGPIHEDVNSFTGPAQCFQQEEGIGEQVLQPVVRPGDKAQRQREQGLQVKRVRCHQREIEVVAGGRAKQVERDSPGIG